MFELSVKENVKKITENLLLFFKSVKNEKKKILFCWGGKWLSISEKHVLIKY